MKPKIHPEPKVEPVSPGVWRLPLPSDTLPPFDHTNSYLIADGGVGVLVDPGSAGTAEALPRAMDAAGVRLLKAVLLTHTHRDHKDGLEPVLRAFDATVYVHPLELPRLEGQRAARALQDGRVLTVGNKTLRALHTPGHSPGSTSFYLPETKTLLVGDLLTGEGSSWIGLPEGDVGAYLESLDRLKGLDLERIGPGHGPVIAEPHHKLREAQAHRLEREGQVVAALGAESLTLSELRDTVYPGLHELLRDLTERSLLAHLKKLMGEMRVLHLGEDEQGPYALRK